jgi:hypothetical protein
MSIAKDSRTAEQVNSHRYAYTYELFRYTCFLNEKTESRANYLIVANSIFAATVAALAKDFQVFILTSIVTMTGILLIAILLLSSIALCISAILPRIFDYHIPINNTVIAAKKPTHFVAEMLSIKESEMVRNFSLEIHVLSRIAGVRFHYVSWAARVFFLMIVLTGAMSLYIFIIALHYVPHSAVLLS